MPERQRDRTGSGHDLVVLQTVSADYRQPVWEALAKLNDGRVIIVAGGRYFDPTIVTRHGDYPPLVRVQNRYLLGRRLLIQRLPLRILLDADAVIAELNPRILTTWLLLGLRRIRRKRTILWGHGFSRRPSAATKRLRDWMRRLPDAIVAYTESEREALATAMPNKDIRVAPNALFPQSEMRPMLDSDAARNFIYVGRLVEAKRPDLLVQAYLSARRHLPPGSRLLIVGDGPMRATLEQSVAAANAEANVSFYGHVSRVEDLRSLYATAVASVSPGYVGLSLIQSLAVGVPMIIADDEPHSPEIEAAEPGFNCVFFKAGSVPALMKAIIAVVRDARDWRHRAKDISSACRARYSTEAMAECLLAACWTTTVTLPPHASGAPPAAGRPGSAVASRYAGTSPRVFLEPPSTSRPPSTQRTTP